MEWQVNVVNVDVVEELVFVGEGFYWCVSGQRKYIFFFLYQVV